LLGKNFISDMNTPLCMVHARDEAGYERAANTIRAAYSIGESAHEISPVIERIA
jgi:thymidine phosphorylase